MRIIFKRHETTEQGDQYVSPGIAPITPRDRFEIQAQAQKRSTVPQQAAGPLFGETGKLAPDLFSDPQQKE